MKSPGETPRGGGGAGEGVGDGANGGDSAGGGGAGVGGGVPVPLPLSPVDLDWCGSSNPAAVKVFSPMKATATSLSKQWKENPEQSCRYTSSFGGGVE